MKNTKYNVVSYYKGEFVSIVETMDSKRDAEILAYYLNVKTNENWEYKTEQ